MRLVDGSWCWVVVGIGIGGLSGVRVFGWKGVGNLGIGKVDLIWTPGRRPADLLAFECQLRSAKATTINRLEL